jgi:ABC-type sugar transport system substrate-binding protein
MSKEKDSWKTILKVLIPVAAIAAIGFFLAFVVLDKQSPEPTIVEPEDEQWYPFLAGNNRDPFYDPAQRALKDFAATYGVKTSFEGPMDLNLTSQMTTFEQLCNDPRVSGVYYYPMDFNAAEIYIKDCKEKGKPVVIGAADSPFKTRAGFIGVSDEVFGSQAGMWAEELTKCDGKVGTIALVQANTDARIKAFGKYLSTACPDLKQAERVTHDGSAASASAALDAYLVANPDLTLVYFADGSGGQQAAFWKDKQADPNFKTMFLATDSPPLTLQAVKDGIFIGTVAQDTYIETWWAMLMLYSLHNGKGVPDIMYLPVNRIDQSNVDQFMPAQ